MMNGLRKVEKRFGLIDGEIAKQEGATAASGPSRSTVGSGSGSRMSSKLDGEWYACSLAVNRRQSKIYTHRRTVNDDVCFRFAGILKERVRKTYGTRRDQKMLGLVGVLVQSRRQKWGQISDKDLIECVVRR